MENTSIQFNFHKHLFLFCQNFIFLHTGLCSEFLLTTHSKYEIKAVTQIVDETPFPNLNYKHSGYFQA